MARIHGLSNADVAARFQNGAEGYSGNGNFSSVPQEGATMLRSYSTVIAIRRDDGETFYDAHGYSSTTSQHQAAVRSWRAPQFSFTCVIELAGADWWRTASITDYGPRPCRNPACRASADARRDHTYLACDHPGESEDHAQPIKGYDQWLPAVLLDISGQATILTGFEPGKRVQYNGRQDQLWAASLPQWARDMNGAFNTLRPRTDDPDRLIRQGDVYFEPFTGGRCECPCHTDPSAIAAPENGAEIPAGLEAIAARHGDDAAAIAALQTRAGAWKRHGCNPSGYRIPDVVDLPYGGTYAPGTSRYGQAICKRAAEPPASARDMPGLALPEPNGRHVAAESRMRPDWTMYARGYVTHPQHPRVHLPRWCVVKRSRAVRAVSSAYGQGMGRGRAYVD